MSEAAGAGEGRRSDIRAMLDKMTAAELGQVIEMAEVMRQEKMAATQNELVAEFRAKAEQLGLRLNFDALVPRPSNAPHGAPRGRKGESRGKVAAKFRGPNGEEWTGRGKTPKWLEAAEATGRKREEFAVKA